LMRIDAPIERQFHRCHKGYRLSPYCKYKASNTILKWFRTFMS